MYKGAGKPGFGPGPPMGGMPYGNRKGKEEGSEQCIIIIIIMIIMTITTTNHNTNSNKINTNNDKRIVMINANNTK